MVKFACLTLIMLLFLDLPNELAWGTKKKMFYNSDYVAASKYLSCPAMKQSVMFPLPVCLMFANATF